MPDRENVIYDIERCICHVPDACRDCSHYGHGEAIGCMEELLTDAIDLLKEDCHNCKLECLLQKYDELKEKYDALLKKQEAKPLRCKECSYHRNDGWCNEHRREVKESDYCSFGAWEGWRSE